MSPTRKGYSATPRATASKRSLSTAGGPNDQVDLTLSEDILVLDPEAGVSTRRTGSDGSRGLGRPGEGGVANTDLSLKRGTSATGR